MPQGTGYWIDPNGQVQRLPDGKHIDQMIAAPARFGLTREQIVDCYREVSEPLGLEGRARRKLIEQAIQGGFIHIRHDLRRGWIVTVWEQSPAVLATLRDWANEAVGDPWAGQFATVRLRTLCRTEEIRMTIEALRSPL
jgi:hypothetical protein